MKGALRCALSIFPEAFKMGGGGLANAAQAVGSGFKGMWDDTKGQAQNDLFGVQHPVQQAKDGDPNATNNYQKTAMGQCFGAGQPTQETPAQRMRRTQGAGY